jgi:uncharacterized protein YqeY
VIAGCGLPGKELKMSDSSLQQEGRQTSLLLRLKEDLKDALRKKDEVRRNAIRQIMAEYPRLTVPLTLESGKQSTRPKKPEEITDDDILGIIGGLVKSEQIVLDATGKETSDYLQILQAYLPRLADRETIVAWIRENIDFARYKNKMQAMGTIMTHFGKSADGKMVNAILKQWR